MQGRWIARGGGFLQRLAAIKSIAVIRAGALSESSGIDGALISVKYYFENTLEDGGYQSPVHGVFFLLCHKK